jgi:hypothetical protein
MLVRTKRPNGGGVVRLREAKVITFIRFSTHYGPVSLAQLSQLGL